MNNKELDKKIKSICHDLRYNQGFITTIDVLLKLEYLSSENLDKWKKGQVAFLEKVCTADSGKLAFMNKAIKSHTNELKLKPSFTSYKSSGEGQRKRLIFTRTALQNIEEAYATHFVDVKRVTELKNNTDSPE